MKRILSLSLLLVFIHVCVCAQDKDKKKEEVNKQRIKELDAYWIETSRCVGEGDWDAYLKTVHPDGILVAGKRGYSVPLTKVFVKWKKEFNDTKAGKIKASVEFRLSKRFGDETTAHESGMFLYKQTNAEGKKIAEYIHFEALLIKKEGQWLIMMEYQKSGGTKEEWDKLAKISK